MTTTGSQQPKSSHALLLQHRAKIMGVGLKGGREGRKERKGGRKGGRKQEK